MNDLFSLASASRFMQTPESEFLVDLIGACLQPLPTEPVWKWAEKNVWLDEKQSSEPKAYDSSLTPWVREWQTLPMNPDVREGVFMKSSQTGVTEGSLNILRWMPQHWPGNALYSINSDKKAREVAERRILPTIGKAAGAHLSDDPDDTTLSRVSLKNMDIVISGSGSAGPFMEAWYRLIILDEIEHHATNQLTTTYDRAKSRQTTVADALLLALSKPEDAGGIIDLKFISGSQKKFLVPCPRCGQRIELLTKFLIARHCKEGDEWNLERVVKETFYQCQLCQGKIEEHEKRAMVNEGIWTPTPNAQRRRTPEGKHVPAEPGVESYQISDLYSPFDAVSWGNLMKLYLNAYVIAPNEEAKKFFRTNHEGLPWERETYNITADTIRALQAGRVEEQVIKAADGTESAVRVQVGEPFRLAYRDHRFNARLPFRPALLFATIDKQADHLKFMVCAWNSQGEGFLVDLGRFDDESQLWNLRARPYKVEGRKKPEFIFSGLFDCGHRREVVYRACIEHQTTACHIHPSGWRLHPCRGEGPSEDYRGKLSRVALDYCDKIELPVRYFYDFGLKSHVYLGQIQKRGTPRFWLPTDYPNELEAELTAEVYDPLKKVWIHEKQKRGPNDYGDLLKYQYGGKLEFGPLLANLPRPDPEEDEAPSVLTP